MDLIPENLKREALQYLNLFRQKLQEIQQNQEVLAKNQEILAKQNNQIISAMKELINGLNEEPEEDIPLEKVGVSDGKGTP